MSSTEEEDSNDTAIRKLFPQLSNEKKDNPDETVYMIPANNSRTRQSKRKQKEREFPGYDSDTEKLEAHGYHLIQTTEHSESEGTITVEPDTPESDVVFSQSTRNDIIYNHYRRRAMAFESAVFNGGTPRGGSRFTV
jgi:hypothetical protein